MITVRMTLKELMNLASMGAPARAIVNSFTDSEWQTLEETYDECDFEGIECYDEFVNEMARTLDNSYPRSNHYDWKVEQK